MCRVHGRDDHHVRLGLRQHLPKIGGPVTPRHRRPVLRGTTAGQVHAAHIRVAQPDEFGRRRMGLFDPILVQLVP